MPPINEYRCDHCGLEFPSGWGGTMYVVNEDGKRVVCPHPAEGWTVEQVLVPILAGEAARLVARALSDAAAGDAVVEYLRGLAGAPHVPGPLPVDGHGDDPAPRPQEEDPSAWRAIVDETGPWDRVPLERDSETLERIAGLQSALAGAGFTAAMVEAAGKLAFTSPEMTRRVIRAGARVRRGDGLASAEDVRRIDAIAAEFFPARRKGARGGDGLPPIRRSRRDRLLSVLRETPWNPECECLDCACAKAVRNALRAGNEPGEPDRPGPRRRPSPLESRFQEMVFARTGFDSDCICLDCCWQFKADLADEAGNEWRSCQDWGTRIRDMRMCFACGSENVKTVLEMVGQPCPKCRRGRILEFDTGVMC